MAFIFVIWSKSIHSGSFFPIPYFAFCFLFSFCFCFFPEGKGENGEAANITLQARFITAASVFIQLCSSLPNLPQEGLLQGRNVFGAKLGACHAWLEMATHNCGTMPASPLVDEQGGGFLLF
ncbi:hypothetical protein V8C34DRAFT_239382 [Trichoderma compactum]